jgi:hypothetical protein
MAARSSPVEVAAQRMAALMRVLRPATAVRL